MTTTDKPTRRETLSQIRYKGKLRPIILEVCATFVKVRPKGCRESYVVDIGAIYHLGAKLRAMEVRAEKQTRKGMLAR